MKVPLKAVFLTEKDLFTTKVVKKCRPNGLMELTLAFLTILSDIVSNDQINNLIFGKAIKALINLFKYITFP